MSFLQTSRDVIACDKFYLALPMLVSISSDKTLESEGLGTKYKATFLIATKHTWCGGLGTKRALTKYKPFRYSV